MSCTEVRSLLPFKPLRALEEDEASFIDRHIVACEPCREQALELEAALELIKGPVPETAAPALWEKIQHELDTPSAPRDEAPPVPDLAIAIVCTFCRDALARAEAVYCASCLAPHHGECWRAHGRCSAFGCEETHTVRPQGTAVEPAKPTRHVGRGAILVLGALLGGGGLAAAALSYNQVQLAQESRAREEALIRLEYERYELEKLRANRAVSTLDSPLPLNPWKDAKVGDYARFTAVHHNAFMGDRRSARFSPSVSVPVFRVVRVDGDDVFVDVGNPTPLRFSKKTPPRVRDFIPGELGVGSVEVATETREIGGRAFPCTKVTLRAKPGARFGLDGTIWFCEAVKGAGIVAEEITVTGNNNIGTTTMTLESFGSGEQVAWKATTKPAEDAPVAPPRDETAVIDSSSEVQRDAPLRQAIDCTFESASLRSAMHEISKRVGRPILVAPEVSESVTVSLSDIPWRDAVDAIAKMTKCEVRELSVGTLLLEQPPKVTIQFTDANVRTVLQLLAAYSGKNIILAPNVGGWITLDLHEVHWLVALRAIVRTCGFHARSFGDIIVVSGTPIGPGEDAIQESSVAASTETSKRIDVAVEDAELRDVIEAVGRQVGARIVVEPGTEMKLSLDVRGIPWRDLLLYLERCHDIRVEREGPIVVLSSPPKATFKSSGNVRSWFQGLASSAGKNVAIAPEVQGELTVELAGTRPMDAILATAAAKGFAVRDKDGVLEITADEAAMKLLETPRKIVIPDVPATQKRGPVLVEAAGKKVQLLLTAILIDQRAGGENHAIVNDQILSVGSPVFEKDEPVRIVVKAIAANCVTLAAGDKDVVLELGRAGDR